MCCVTALLAVSPAVLGCGHHIPRVVFYPFVTCADNTVLISRCLLPDRVPTDYDIVAAGFRPRGEGLRRRLFSQAKAKAQCR